MTYQMTLVEKLDFWAHLVGSGTTSPEAGQVMREAATELTTLLQRNKELEADNFALSAGACIVKNGLLSGEGGSPYCTLLQRCEKAEAAAGDYGMVRDQYDKVVRQRNDALKALQAVDATAAFNTKLGKYMIEPHALDMVSNAIRAGGKS